MDPKIRIWDAIENCWFVGEWHFSLPGSITGRAGYVVSMATGLEDINGIEIFEGDIVRYYEKMDDHGEGTWLEGVVKYEPTRACFELHSLVAKEMEDGYLNSFTDYTIDHFEVIGNTYQSPLAKKAEPVVS